MTSIAILPFENLSGDQSNAYFADGMQDEIITRLAKIGGLRVISRSSTLRYRAPQDPTAIAQELGVAAFLEGSVQRIGEHVRINVQLIRTDANDHLWAEIYDRDLADVFAVQSEVATAIADALHLTLSPHERAAVTRRPTDNLAAYDAYLRGLEAASQPAQAYQTQTKAVESFQEACVSIPASPRAWAALAQVHAGDVLPAVRRQSATRRGGAHADGERHAASIPQRRKRCSRTPTTAITCSATTKALACCSSRFARKCRAAATSVRRSRALRAGRVAGEDSLRSVRGGYGCSIPATPS